MVKINEFHVGKNDVKLRGDWTLISPEKEKKRKKLTSTGFDPGTFRSQEQNTTTELRRHVTKSASKKLTNQYSYDTVLANFSQVPPLSAYFHLYSTNLDLFPQLFSLYDFLVLPCALFQNISFWLYLWSLYKNSNFFCGRLIHFLPHFSQSIPFFCTLVQTLEKKLLLNKFRVWAKILRGFLISLINRHS